MGMKGASRFGCSGSALNSPVRERLGQSQQRPLATEMRELSGATRGGGRAEGSTRAPKGGTRHVSDVGEVAGAGAWGCRLRAVSCVSRAFRICALASSAAHLLCCREKDRWLSRWNW